MTQPITYDNLPNSFVLGKYPVTVFRKHKNSLRVQYESGICQTFQTQYILDYLNQHQKSETPNAS